MDFRPAFPRRLQYCTSRDTKLLDPTTHFFGIDAHEELLGTSDQVVEVFDAQDVIEDGSHAVESASTNTIKNVNSNPKVCMVVALRAQHSG